MDANPDCAMSARYRAWLVARTRAIPDTSMAHARIAAGHRAGRAAPGQPRVPPASVPHAGWQPRRLPPQ
eukprot:4448375-Alexandrium_andersonii.AAC.1